MACPGHGRRSMAKIKANSLPPQRSLRAKTLHGTREPPRAFLRRERRKRGKKRSRTKGETSEGTNGNDGQREEFGVADVIPQVIRDVRVSSQTEVNFGTEQLKVSLRCPLTFGRKFASSESSWNDERVGISPSVRFKTGETREARERNESRYSALSTTKLR